MRMGVGTGTGQTPTSSIIVRQAYSTNYVADQILGRTADMQIERDGTNGGIRVERLNVNDLSVNCTGLTSTGAAANFHGDYWTVGTTQIYTDAQAVVYFQCMFGNFYGAGQFTTLTMSREAGDYYWLGFITSTYNQ